MKVNNDYLEYTFKKYPDYIFSSNASHIVAQSLSIIYDSSLFNGNNC